MNHEWGSSEDLQVGDIFRCDSVGMPFSGRPEHYPVAALRGRTQAVLQAVRTETYTQEGISEDGPCAITGRGPAPCWDNS